MRFSIIIPSYNQEAYLKDAIESALAQDFTDYEVIVVDDGSTDKSLSIAKSYEPKIKVVSQVNKGLSSTRNTGIMNAIGEYIYPLDADDMMRKDCLTIVDKHLKETDADILAPSFMTIGTTNQVVYLMDNPTLDDFKIANRIGYFSAIRRSKLLEVGGYSPKMVWGYEDYHLWQDMLKRGFKLVTVKDVLIMYRTKENSMITTAQAHHEELMAQIKKDIYDTNN
jgi:glycosyltransferase involved in cell wall biosynthesis